MWPAPLAGLAWLAMAAPAVGKTVVSCGGAALLSGVELLCSHVDPSAPAQVCNYSWALAGVAGVVAVVKALTLK